ncbi:MAG: glycosyltransferase [Saprospiraceae bacterium]
MKILIVTDDHVYAIGKLFASAFNDLGHDVICFDLNGTIRRHIKLGRAGRIIHNFLPLEAWVRKGNRELAIRIKDYQPDQIIISGHVELTYGTIAFVKTILPNLKVTLFWPDPLINLTQHELNLARLLDKLVSYSKNTLQVFNQLGFGHTEWMPFAGDIKFLGEAEINNTEFIYDLAFIGAWRPEREKAIEAISRSMPHLNFKVIGTSWEKNVKNKGILKHVKISSIFGQEYGNLIRQSRINLNIIDDTNFPAANMRFFEIPAAGGLQLSSSCPEQDDIFLHEEHIYYYKNELDLCEMIKYILEHKEQASEARKKGHELAITEHTYLHRVQKLLS